MPDDWYYAQTNERRGPVSFAKLKAMAGDGWLGRDDLVWRQGMPTRVPARPVGSRTSCPRSPALPGAAVAQPTG